MNLVCKTKTYIIIHLKHHATNDFQQQNLAQQASVAAMVAIFVTLWFCVQNFVAKLEVHLQQTLMHK